MGHHLFKVMHSTTVSVPHKELHPIKDTGVFKTPSWMEETWVANHTVVLTTYHRTDVPILVNVSMKRLCGKLRKWDGSEWSWFRLSGLIFETLWSLATQCSERNACIRMPLCHRCIVYFYTILLMLRWGVKTSKHHTLENPRSEDHFVRCPYPLDFSFGWRFPPKDTAEARAEREVQEAAKKTVKIRKHKSLDWAEVSWPSDNFSGRILQMPQDLFWSLHPISFRGKSQF